MKYISLFLGLMLCTSLALGQTRSGSKTGNDPNQTNDPAYDWSWNTGGIPTTPPPPPTPVPIDGGMGFLLAAGIGFGLRKLKK